VLRDCAEHCGKTIYTEIDRKGIMNSFCAEPTDNKRKSAREDNWRERERLSQERIVVVRKRNFRERTLLEIGFVERMNDVESTGFPPSPPRNQLGWPA
jgi:hypothetical protein